MLQVRLSALIATALTAALATGCASDDDPPPGGVDAATGTVDAPPGATDAAVDAPPAGCADVRGTWGFTGSCGADTCVITQSGCDSQLACSGGAASYTGTVSGNQLSYSGTTAGGTPAMCTATVNGNTMSGTCTVVGAPCTFTGQRL